MNRMLGRGSQSGIYLFAEFFKGGLVVSGKWRVKVMTERRWLETSSPEWGTYKKDRWARVQHQEQSDAI
jgi:hypothetical protein